MSKTATIKWSPFSDKHKEYIKSAFKNKVSVAEGAVRSGKTIDNCIAFADLVDKSEDKLHLATGSTLANAKMNIGDCNGYGLEHLFRGRCRKGKYQENEALYIRDYKGREKIVIFAGGGKADSYKKILGNSYGGWIATEINEHYDADDSQTSFIKVALARQVASHDPRIFWDLNPSSPNHKIYKEYIDKWRESGLVGGYNYQHFTMADNLSISDERKKEIESMYNPASVWYRRDILGQRCVAEGIIYQTFADNPKKYEISKNEMELLKSRIYKIECGVDFGGNGSKHTFVASAFLFGFSDVIVLKSQRIFDSSNLERLNNMFVLFCEEIYNKYGKSFYSNYDNAEVVLGNELQTIINQNHLHAQSIPATKLPINQRIRAVSTLISQNRLWYVEGECDSWVNAMSSAVWDSKKPDTRLDDGTSDIDTLDAFEYSFEKEIYNLLQVRETRLKELANGLQHNN